LIRWVGKQASYDGSWVDGTRDGKGIMRYEDGSSFEGTFRNDNEVEGTMTWPSGATFVGNYENY
jgi:hypothetical protein